MAASARQYHQTWKESWKPQKCSFTEECYTYLGRTMSQMMRYSKLFIISCLQWLSATARIHPSFLQCRLGSVSLSEMCAARHDVVQVACGCAAHTVFAVPVAPQMSGWQPVPSALGWMSAMHATAACGHSGVVLLGRCCTSLDCCLFAPTVLATSPYGLLRAYTGEAWRLKRNFFESVGDSSRAGGDGGCVAGLSVVWCAGSGCVRCASFPEGRFQTERRGPE